MTDKQFSNRPGHQFQEGAEQRSMDPREIEVRLAIADHVIHRVGGTPAGREIFDALIKRFENRYPQHKLLAHLLTSPGHLEMGADDLED
ncbi:hypothetical protein [Pseudomonas chlororaphis]